jgi:Rhs element Vgr protein
MTVTRVSDASLTTFTLKANGRALSGDLSIEYIDIRRMVNRISSAEIALLDGSVADQDFAASASDELGFGSEIEIQLGYNSDEQTMFKGILVKQQIKVTRSGQSRLIISCRDAAYKMSLSEKSGHFSSMSDSDVIERLASNYVLSVDVESTSVTHTDVVQLRESDWDFMLQRAQRNGLVVLTQDGELVVKSPQLGSSSGQLVYGRNVVSADLQLDAQQQFEHTAASAWSSANQQVEQQDGSARMSEPGDESASAIAALAGGSQKLLSADGDIDAASLLNWASAAVVRQQLGKVLGTITIQGSPDISAGDWVDLDGFGRRFNGQAYIGGIMHSVSRGDWLTTLQIGLSPQWHMQQFASSLRNEVLSTQAANLHIAKVTALSDDPDGAQRIQVKIMALGDDQEGVWARLTSADAGNERGWVVRPEIEDEVIVGFIDGDAAQPIVLGSLYSSANATPIAANDDDNHEKGWVTRSGMRFVFNDDSVNLNIETPNGNVITIDDDAGSVTLKDQNDNSIVMDSNGIAMTSASDINIEARGDVNISATNINQQGQVEVKLNGSAGATLESGGNTTIKGSLVSIN